MVSEFFNRYLRLEFELLKSKEPDKYQDFRKNFKSSAEWKDCIKSITSIFEKHIFKIVKRIDDKFGSLNLKDLLNNIENFDFNDKYYLQLSDEEKFKIVTDDAGFAIGSNKMPIITANYSNMLKKVMGMKQ